MRDSEVKKALQIGITLTLTYIASYYMRNMLGVLTPAMLQTGGYTKEYLGLLSSVYMIMYALGQLTNGFIGDYVSPKNMIAAGLFVSGTASICFPLTSSAAVQTVCFAALGYGLSMLRGPMMKVISENTKSNHARIICAFFSSATFTGAIIAGIFAAVFNWDKAFIAAGIVGYIVAIGAYTVIARLEKKGMITVKSSEKKEKLDLLGAFKANKFVFFLVISILSEITTSAINFWIPTYLSEYLGFSNNDANMIYIVKSVIHSAAPFIAIFLYKFIKNEIKILEYLFLIAGIFFVGMVFIANTWMNIIFFFAALLVSGVVWGIVWSIYIPSLKSTGKVSSANGILDCAGYAGAAIANVFFSLAMGALGWNGLIIVWACIMFFGTLISALELRRG